MYGLNLTKCDKVQELQVIFQGIVEVLLLNWFNNNSWQMHLNVLWLTFAILNLSGKLVYIFLQSEFILHTKKCIITLLYNFKLSHDTSQNKIIKVCGRDKMSKSEKQIWGNHFYLIIKSLFLYGASYTKAKSCTELFFILDKMPNLIQGFCFKNMYS